MPVQGHPSRLDHCLARSTVHSTLHLHLFPILRLHLHLHLGLASHPAQKSRTTDPLTDRSGCCWWGRS